MKTHLYRGLILWKSELGPVSLSGRGYWISRSAESDLNLNCYCSTCKLKSLRRPAAGGISVAESLPEALIRRILSSKLARLFR